MNTSVLSRTTSIFNPDRRWRVLSTISAEVKAGTDWEARKQIDLSTNHPKRVYCEQCLEDHVVRAIAFAMGWIEKPRIGGWFCPGCVSLGRASEPNNNTKSLSQS